MNDIVTEIRKHIIYMTHYSKSSHVGACLSCVELLYALYFEVMKIDAQQPKSFDLFFLSKAHASAALYATLIERGLMPRSYLDQFYIDGGILPGHLDKEVSPWIQFSGGSLGHGLSIALGTAIALKQKQSKNRVFVLLGDGECNEGSVWEAIMLAGHLKMDNLTAIIDYNTWQAFGRVNEIIDQTNLAQRWAAFGWEVHELDGHNVRNIVDVLKGKGSAPRVAIAHTVKGKGVSFMEDTLEWHYRSPNDQQYKQAICELEGKI